MAPGTRIYAFGDLHGRADLLHALFEAIRIDCESASELRVVVVGLGDYVDRGRDARDVVEMLIHGISGCEIVALRGNHEQMMLDFLSDPMRLGSAWLSLGGIDTLRSYGVNVRGLRTHDAAALKSLRDLFALNLPAHHNLFLQQLPLSYSCGDYFFAHAGVRATLRIEQQSEHDLLWIREGFADRDAPAEKVIVHGHTPVESAFIGRYRINLDTGAYFTNRLSCIVLENTMRRLLEV